MPKRKKIRTVTYGFFDTYSDVQWKEGEKINVLDKVTAEERLEISAEVGEVIDNRFYWAERLKTKEFGLIHKDDFK